MFGRRSRDGVGLRTYLTALVSVPLLVGSGFAALAVFERVGDARTAGAIAARVHEAAALQAVQGDAQLELIPAIAHVVVTTPQLRRLLNIRTITEQDLGVSSAKVRDLRADTDRALSDVADLPALRGTADRVRAELSRDRNEIDSVLELPNGYDRMIALSASLGVQAHRLMGDAVNAGSGATLNSALRDSILVAAAAQAGANQLATLAAFKFPGLGDHETTVQARVRWLNAWSSTSSSAQSVLTQATAPTAARWRAASSSASSRAFDTQLSAYAFDTSRPLSIPQLAALYRTSVGRDDAVASVLAAVSARSTSIAAARRSSSNLTAALLAALALVVLLGSAAVGVWVRRAIGRPLNTLAGEATSISEGELVDVTVDGPREVRTVADGLSAAVANLRRIEAQATAVAQGELASDIVREPMPGPLGAVVHSSVTTIVDAIHERDAAQSDLAYQATHDALTGLPNRTQAMVAIKHALQRARRTGALTALMYVDLDFFKLVNDNHGHASGDTVLRVCAERMSEIVRDSDLVYRLGGDEFVALLEDTSRDFPFVALAERLIERVSAPISVGDHVVHVGASVGISLCQDASLDAERLLSEADAAAYSAKAAGRGRVGVFDEALRSSLVERATVEEAIHEALDHDQFVLHYQPVVEMSSARPTGFEALIRWQHPTDGLVYPDAFIPIAEKTSLINEIGRWTLREATAQLARWDAEGGSTRAMSMAVNISGRHLVSIDLLHDVDVALAASRIDPSRLVVEITETVLIDDPVALNNMHELRRRGVVVAIDDFGTGYTSIGQLPKLPIDVLKIDRSFTVSEQQSHQQLVRLIVEAAHAFGLSVVAEGIEEAAQADVLNRLHVDTGQGYFFARPQPVGAAVALAAHPSLPPG